MAWSSVLRASGAAVKTSVLRMVEETVRAQSSTTIVHFNPWLFSNSHELVSRFLQELGTQLRTAGEAQTRGRPTDGGG
jgi:predicted KAP-like P-loop ATPase